MPLPLRAPDNSLLRFRIVYGDVPRLAHPLSSSDLTLTREPGEGSEAGAFYYRDKLSGGPLQFTGDDFTLLYAIEQSTARCEPLGLLVDHRGNPTLPWETWRGSFTCNDCQDWNPALCTVSIAPENADPYQKLFDNWEREYNILLAGDPKNRTTVTAELQTLAAGITIEFRPVSLSEESDYIGVDGWALFLKNRSWIPDGPLRGLRNDIDILFRYRLKNVPKSISYRPDGTAVYTPVNKSDTGWEILLPEDSSQVDNKTVDYVKSPGIAGFKTYEIGTYNDWNDPRNGARTSRHGDALLLIDASKTPADYGYRTSDYIELTGAGGFNSPPDECPSGVTVRIRRYVDDEQCSRLYWRFGNFKFGRCFPFLDGLYCILSQTVAAYGGQALLPPTPAQLSQFLSQPVNQATGETGAANELPRLRLSAGSDVKRYGASEPATRLLISLKQLLADMGWWDGGWFIDPATGWLRYEHRAWREAQQGTGATVDLRALEDVLLSNAYAYRTQALPRYETLEVASASTEDLATDTYYGKASLDYGLSACVNTKEGSNRTTVSIGRLTGDVAAGVLNGDQLPDNCLFVLAPDVNGRLPNANRELASSTLLFRYWRRGRPAGSATIEGPAPAAAPNSVVGPAPVTGIPALIESVRPARVQAGISGRLCSLATLVADGSYQTNLGTDGQLGKAEVNLHTRQLKLTAWLPGRAELTPPPPVGGRQFDRSFNESFD